MSDSDPDELHNFVWYVRACEVKHPKWFREVKWNQGANLTDEEPVSPRSMPTNLCAIDVKTAPTSNDGTSDLQKYTGTLSLHDQIAVTESHTR